MKKDDVIMSVVIGGIGVVFAVIAFLVHSTVAKWIWGILAVAVIGLCIYGTIDAIVRSRRKPKDMAELMVDFLKEQAKKPDFAEKMMKGIESGAQRREALYAGQRPEEDDYGYSTENPIMTSTINSTDRYLEALRTEGGKAVTWERLGSICLRELYGCENIMVDRYQLFVDGTAFKEIYICPYGHQSSHAPKGMYLAE